MENTWNSKVLPKTATRGASMLRADAWNMEVSMKRLMKTSVLVVAGGKLLLG